MPNLSCLKTIQKLALILVIISFLVKKILGISSFNEYMNNVIIPIIGLIIMEIQPREFNQENIDRNNLGRPIENNNRNNPRMNGAIIQTNILRRVNPNDLVFEDNGNEEANLSGDSSQSYKFKGEKKIKINKFFKK